jgi:anthranilate phosphoribosyltransferase
MREGVALAARSIDSGDAMDRLQAFLAILGTGEKK